MIRLALIVMGAVLLMAQAPAPSSREAVRQACDADVRRHCPDAGGNPFRIRACLTAEPARLAPACRTALQAAGLLPP